MNILFVCTGNTCRSPMAEGYVNARFKNITAKSCGLYTDGSPVSENSKLAMEQIGIDISSHISAPLTRELLLWANDIICMSPSHQSALNSIGIKAQVLGDGICDPYGRDLDTYITCRDRIIEEINKLLNEIKVVPIEYKHIKEIAKLEKICFSTPWSENAIKEAYQNGTKFFVAVKDNKVLGYASISAIIDEGYITNIAVFPDYRNQGVGSALLNHLFSFAEEKALSFISLEVRESNRTAISLYEKFGFKTEGKRKNFYTEPSEDALIMTKRFD